MALPKWTDERTETLTKAVGKETPVSVATVAEVAEQLETTPRSVAAKLRKMGYEVESSATERTKSFTEAEEDELGAFVRANDGKYTYAEIAAAVCGGKYSAKQVQGKILSMELTDHVKPTPKQEVVKKYSEKEEQKFIELVKGGAFIEDIAEALGKSINSVRGKALSLSRQLGIELPKQRDSHAKVKTDPLADLGDVSDMTVAEIAEAIDKTERGVKVMLTHRSLSAKDYDGAKRAANIEARKAS